MRLFLDANVLFSAAKSAGAVRRLLTLLDAAGHALVADAYVVEEARRNLAARYPEALQDLDSLLLRMSLVDACHLDPDLSSSLPLPDMDRPVLMAAIRRGCDAIATGDRQHFGPLYGQTLHGVQIHSPRSLAAWLPA